MAAPTKADATGLTTRKLVREAKRGCEKTISTIFPADVGYKSFVRLRAKGI